MRKILIAGVLSLFLGVSVLFSGCGTDLSGINSQIQQMQQQIDSLNQTILDLQNQLSNSNNDIDELRKQLIIATNNYNNLYERIEGTENKKYEMNEVFTYATNGIKYFDLKFTNAYFTNTLYHEIYFVFNSYISGLDITSSVFQLNFYLFSPETSQVYEFEHINNQSIYTLSIPDDLRNGLLFLYVGNTINGTFVINFDEPLN